MGADARAADRIVVNIMMFRLRHPCAGSLEQALVDTRREMHHRQLYMRAAWTAVICTLCIMWISAFFDPRHSNTAAVMGLLLPVLVTFVIPRAESRSLQAEWRHEDFKRDEEIIVFCLEDAEVVSLDRLVEHASVSMPTTVLLHQAVGRGAIIQLSVSGWRWVRVRNVPDDLSDAMRNAGFVWVSHTSRTWVANLG